MPSLNLLVVGEEKAVSEFEEALESCKRYVGPIKIFSAHKAVDAVGRLQKLVQTCGQCHAAFLDNHFTCPGKEEFSETLRKVIKEKYPDVPVICWGNPKKGGDLNKHYHATLEFSKHGGDVNAVVDILKQVQAGQIRADYLHKGDRKSLERRNSLDRTDSIRGVPRADSLLRRTDSRRGSHEGARPAAAAPPGPALDRNMSSRRSNEVPAEDPAPSPGGAAAGLSSIPTQRRKSIERRGSFESPSMASGYGTSSSMPRGGGGMMSGGGGSMASTSMNNGMAMGMGMGAPMSSMNNGMAMGMGMGAPMSSMNNGMAMGMGMGAPMSSMNNGMAMGMGMGMANGHAGLHLQQQQMQDLAGRMGAMSMGAQPIAPAAAPAPVAAAGGGGNNAELIRMLAEEVVRLRKAVEEKRAREAEAAALAEQQQQILELQQQQMLLQQQILAGGAAAGVGVGVGGGMPMGI